MKKRFLTLLLASTMLVACGKQETKKEETKESTTKVEEKKKEQKKEEKKEENQVEEKNGMKKTVFYTDKNLKANGTTGSINYAFTAIQISKLEATTDASAAMLQIEKGKEVTLVSINAEAENTKDEDVNFYIDQAKLITNTKEQVDSNMLFGDHIDGAFLGKVKKNGNLVYILKNTKAEDLKELEFRISAPSNKNFKNIGEDVNLKLTINK